MKKFVALSLAILVSGCATTEQVITREKLTVVAPDRSMYHCPSIESYPNPETLTDTDVAKLLVQAEKNNSECRRNMKSIQNFIEQAKKNS